MLVKIVKIDGSDLASIEAATNAACEELVQAGRFVVGIEFIETTPSASAFARKAAIIRHMPDQTADASAKAMAAENALQRIVEDIRPAAEPDDGKYDDTESAHSNGMDVANWETAARIDAVLSALRA